MLKEEIEKVAEELNKCNIPDLAKEWTELAKACRVEKQVIIVNAGLVKAGKSELFNALVDQPEQFLTGAARKTTRNKKIKWQKGIFLIDTPGIDARESDTEKAFQAFRQADLVLFVHNVDMGEYKQAECEFVERLRSCFPNESEFLQRVWFIASWADRKETTGELDIVLGRMREQLINMNFLQVPEIMALSSTRYLTGKKEKKRLMVQRSHINELRSRVLSVADVLFANQETLLQERLKTLQGTALQTLEKRRIAHVSKVVIKKKKNVQFLKQCKNDLHVLLEKLRNSFNAVKTKEGAIRREYDDVL